MREVSVPAALLESIADVMKNPGELSLLLVAMSITGKRVQSHAFSCGYLTLPRLFLRAGLLILVPVIIQILLRTA